MTRPADRPVMGIALMLGFCVLAPLSDAIAKVLGESVPILQLVLIRFALQGALLAPVVWLSTRSFRMPTGVMALVVLRTVIHIAGVGLMFLSLTFLPLAECIAIAFVMPFILLLLGHLWLGEEVGPRRLIACAVGFIGTLMVIQPTFADVGLPALLPLGVALLFALFMLVTRQIAHLVDPVSLQATSGGIAAAILLPIMALGVAADLPGLGVVLPTGAEAALILTLGITATAGHLLMTWSLRFAPSATLAPMQYLEIPVATLLGWLVFAQLPNGLAAAGIAVTIASGLYVVLREHAVSRRAPVPDPGRTA
jgi:drug/metabolite transporter (DMT)-like permease